MANFKTDSALTYYSTLEECTACHTRKRQDRDLLEVNV